MEGISTYADLARMRFVNETVLDPKRDFIAVLTVNRLVTVQAEHVADAYGHHDLYGDREEMRASVEIDCLPAQEQ